MAVTPVDNWVPEEALKLYDGYIVQGGAEFYPYHFQIMHDAVVNHKRYLGICLGMQLLFETSYEYGTHRGLGLIPGEIRRIADVIPTGLKIPHIGWNALSFPGEKSPLFRYINEGDHVYFVHSFYATGCTPYVIATAEYGAPLTAAAQRGNVFGCQFHPDKSGEGGLRIVRAFCDTAGTLC